MEKNWDPSPKDAMSMAAFRWFANTIENDAIALYATERSTYEAIETVLRKTLRELKHLKKEAAVAYESNGGEGHVDGEENGCPDGYVLCNGICLPSCDLLE